MDLPTILDDCLQRLQNGESIGECLARYPEQAANLAPMLTAATQLQTLAGFSLNEAQRLQGKVALRETLAKPAGTSLWSGWRSLRGSVLAGAVAVLLLILGTTTVVATSEPGDLGYPLRIVIERAPVLLATTEVRRSATELSVADRRLAELEDQISARADVEIATLRALLMGDDAAARHAQSLPEQERLQVASRLAAHAAVLNRLAANLANQAPTTLQVQHATGWVLMMAERLQAGQPLPAQRPDLLPSQPGPGVSPPSLGTATPTPSPTPKTDQDELPPRSTLSTAYPPMQTPGPEVTPRPSRSTQIPSLGPSETSQPTRTTAPSLASPTPWQARPSRTPRVRQSATPSASATGAPRPSDMPTRPRPSPTPGVTDNSPAPQSTPTPASSEVPTRPRPSYTPSEPTKTPARATDTPAAQPTRTPGAGGSTTNTPGHSEGGPATQTPGAPGHQ